MHQFTSQEIETIERLRRSERDRIAFFEGYRGELKLLTKYRMSRQLRRRIDESDVIQDAFVKYCIDIDKYLADPQIPPIAWLRRIVRQVLFRMNRTHVEAKCRDLRREEALGDSLKINIEELAASLSSVGKFIYRGELKETLEKVLTSMSPIEREILTLVHFENLTLKQAALELNINHEAAKKRYCRSLDRLRKLQESRLKVFLT